MNTPLNTPTIYFDIVRIISYTIIAPGMVIIATSIWRCGMRRPAILLLALAIYFAWLLFEVTLTSLGINTRDLRAFATPVAVTIAVMVVAILMQLNKRVR